MSELKRAVDTLQNAADQGFEWDDVAGVLAKVEEELIEVTEAINSGDAAHIREEVGDLLFASANLARFLKLDADELLAEASGKFNLRFSGMEKALQSEGKQVGELSLDELMQLWKKIKKNLK